MNHVGDTLTRSKAMTKPDKSVCDAASCNHMPDMFVSVKRVLCQDATTLLSTLKVPSKELCAVEIEHAVLPNSTADWSTHEIGRAALACKQLLFFDARAGAAGLIAAAQQALCVDHATERDAAQYYTQLVPGSLAKLCVCHRACCCGAKRLARERRQLLGDDDVQSTDWSAAPMLNSCPLSGAEYNEPSRVIDRLFWQRTNHLQIWATGRCRAACRH